MEGRPKRIVLDTNVLISALLFEGRASEIIPLLEHEAFILLICKEILEEYVHALAYPRFSLSEEESESMVDEYILPFAETVHSPQLLKPACRDPKDDKFLSCAKAGRADAIISGDQDLLVLEEFAGTPIISINTLLRKFGR